MMEKLLCRWLALVLVATWLVISRTSSAGTCADLSNIPQLEASKRLVGSTFQTLQNSSPLSCARECLLRNRCLSFNFYLQASDCDLNDMNSSNTASSYELGELASGTYYSEISDWPTILAGKCQGHNCDGNTKCEVGVDMTTSCVTADTTGSVCSQPDPIPNGAFLNVFSQSESWSPGRMVIYMCNIGFVQDGLLKCLSDGSWSSVSCKPFFG